MDSCSDQDNPSIDLPSIDEDTGHMLVHYLYTSTYQTLDNLDPCTVDERSIEFKRAVSAYSIGGAYQLSGLQQLAMGKIECLGDKLHTFDIFDIIDKEFPKLLDDDNWFRNYLKERAKATFKENPTLCTDHTFLDRISNVDLNKILVKCIMELYSAIVLGEPS